VVLLDVELFKQKVDLHDAMQLERSGVGSTPTATEVVSITFPE
jgi:hypothetical protein